MIQERNQAATKIRAEGASEKSRIEGRMQMQIAEIESSARAKAEQIKGAADAEATKIYARAYSADPDFFKYWRTLESYKQLLPKFKKTLSTDADYFDYLYNPNSR
jgi:membrane protease subunit HflC